MRIVHVITRMIIGGAQENTLLCCRDLVQIHGDDVLLVTGPALGPEGDLLAQVGAGGVPVREIRSLRRAIHPWRDAASYFELKRVLRAFAPDVVHTHSAKGGMLGRMAATAIGTPAVVHTVHGAPFHPYQPALARAVFRGCERYAARKCHALVSVADAMTDALVAARVAPRSKFTTVYSGMDVAPFLAANEQRDAMRRELGIEPGDIVVGKIARMFRLKGHDDVISAAAQVIPAVDQPVKFLLVGDGELRPQIEAQIERLGLASRFVLTGLVDPRRIAPVIGAMDILVHASLREGLARALPQALIAGKPVASYDVDGAREVVITDETGFLAPPRNVARLAAAITRLAADASLRSRMGREGRRRFTDQFRHEEMTRRLRELYEGLLDSGGRK